MSDKGQFILLDARDGFSFSAYQCLPEQTPKGGVLIIQEVFGVNKHIREVAEFYAAQGYAVLAPAIFDRVKPGIELNYDEAGLAEGLSYALEQLDRDVILDDLAVATVALKSYGKIGCVGYCFGGLLSYLSASRIADLECAVSYYGGRIADALDSVPQVPIMFHFGSKDSHIPLEQVETIKAALPNAPLYIYDADHGFNCDHRGSYDASAAKVAQERTLDFLATHLD